MCVYYVVLQHLVNYYVYSGMIRTDRLCSYSKVLPVFLICALLCNIGYPSELYPALKSREILFVHNIHFSCTTVLKFSVWDEFRTNIPYCTRPQASVWHKLISITYYKFCYRPQRRDYIELENFRKRPCHPRTLSENNDIVHTMHYMKV